MQDRTGQVAVIFVSQRRAGGEGAYVEAIERLASAQPGYCGIDSARGGGGFGITVSWWSDDAAALAWRKHTDHAVVPARGRADWYQRYDVTVATVRRSYRWPLDL